MPGGADTASPFWEWSGRVLAAVRMHGSLGGPMVRAPTSSRDSRNVAWATGSLRLFVAVGVVDEEEALRRIALG
jgi:hypothetical protein